MTELLRASFLVKRMPYPRKRWCKQNIYILPFTRYERRQQNSVSAVVVEAVMNNVG
jgi:hypothetical protein